MSSSKNTDYYIHNLPKHSHQCMWTTALKLFSSGYRVGSKDVLSTGKISPLWLAVTLECSGCDSTILCLDRSGKTREGKLCDIDRRALA